MAHIPVLLKEVIDGLKISSGSKVLDATFGGGGHSAEICRIVGKEGRLVATDADPEARGRLGDRFGICDFRLVTANFRDLDEVLASSGVSEIDAALFDLGLSSFQLDDSGRGFTFQKDEPLKMTFGESPASGFSAEEIVNDWDEDNLADIIYGYGGEQFARRIAGAIVVARDGTRIKTTGELVRIIESAVPDFYRHRRIHCATKTFQAIRITVNDEMGSLKAGISKAWAALRPGGRLAVISFHELEDRIIKNFLRDKKNLGEADLITKKPIVPTEDEIGENPRSRSAKLRIGEKII